MADSSAARIDVLVCDPNLVEHRDQLESLVDDIAICHWATDPVSSEAFRLLERSSVYVGTKFTAEMAQHAPQLELVLVGGAGYDGIDLAQLPADVQVANTFNHETSIAEYVVAAAVLMRRKILQQSRALSEGVWASSVYDPTIPQAHSLADANVGILGYGHIGKAVWQAFRSFGAKGRAIRHTAASETPDELEWLGTLADLGTLLDESDVLVVCVPLNEQTRGIIGASELARLGSNSIVINVSRGPLIDEDALYDALASEIVAGAAIDVWYQYPDTAGHGFPASRPFWELPNALVTPHISGVTNTTFVGRVRDIAKNIRNQVAGNPIDRVVYSQDKS